MKKLKSFIYLDNYKMYSMSSQIFEGLTEYIIDSEKHANKEVEEQKGNFGSGRLMADIIESNSSRTEKKFMHDHSYTLFENELLKNNQVLEIDTLTIDSKIKEIENFNFVKVTCRTIFNDTKHLEDSLSGFNRFGLAVTYVIKSGEFEQQRSLAKILLDTAKTSQEKQQANYLLKTKFDPANLAKEMGLALDDKYIEHLKYLINYGYNGQFEIQLPFSNGTENHLFTGLLKREMLLENELSLIKKYSRETEKEFTLFGILTQINAKKERFDLHDKIKNQEGDATIKESIMNIVTHLTNLEDVFNGKLPYEYVIDPIAVYREF